MNRHLAVLKAVLRKAAQDWGALEQVPSISLFKLRNQRYRWLTRAEEDRLLDTAAPHLRDLLVFLLDTGARLSEAAQLTWRDVQIDRLPRGMVKFMTTKSGLPRSVPLTRQCRAVAEHGSRPALPRGRCRVFLHRQTGPKNGRPRRAKPFNRPHRAFYAACERAEVGDFRIHDTRHTFASRLVMKGVPLMEVSKLLGHSSLAMTMRYAHLVSSLIWATRTVHSADQGGLEVFGEPSTPTEPGERRSTTQRRGSTSNPLSLSERLITSIVQRPICASSRRNLSPA